MASPSVTTESETEPNVGQTRHGRYSLLCRSVGWRVGRGVRFFGSHAGTVLLDDPDQVIHGHRVLHLHYTMKRRPSDRAAARRHRGHRYPAAPHRIIRSSAM